VTLGGALGSREASGVAGRRRARVGTRAQGGRSNGGGGGELGGARRGGGRRLNRPAWVRG
jgi:hypothetical protein